MIFSIANFKGGVGKTTTTLNLGAGLARAGYKTLLIDTDGQANLTDSLGVNLPPHYQDHLNEYYSRRKNGQPIDASPRRIKDNLYLIPSTIDLAVADREYNSLNRREYILEDILESMKGQYDITLIDCPPNMGILTTNALNVSDYVIIPTLAEYLPTKGIKLFIDAVKRYIIGEKLNRDLQIGGIVLTQFNPNPILSRNLAESIAATFPDQIFETRIRRNIALSESQANGMDIFTYSPESNGASDYTALTKELLTRFTT